MKFVPASAIFADSADGSLKTATRSFSSSCFSKSLMNFSFPCLKKAEVVSALLNACKKRMLSLMTDPNFMEVGVYSLLSVFPLPGFKMYIFD